MSTLVDSASLISGATVVSDYDGLGILGKDIPATGAHGASVLYNDFDAGDELKEFRAQVVSLPASGTLTVYEDGSYDFTGAAAGTYSWTYQLYVDGVAVGTPQTVSMVVGFEALPAVALSSAGTLTATLATPTPGAALTMTASGVATMTASLSTGNVALLQLAMAAAATLAGEMTLTQPISLSLSSRADLNVSPTTGVQLSLNLAGQPTLDAVLQISPQMTLVLGASTSMEAGLSAENVAVLDRHLELQASSGFELIDDQRITQVAVGNKLAVGWGRLRFSPAAPEEALRLGFDFSRRMEPEDVITSAQVEVDVLEGADASAGHILHPILGHNGQQVIARVQGVQPYVVYRLTCVVMTQTGDMLRLVAELPGVTG